MFSREALYRQRKEQQSSKKKKWIDFQMPTWEQILHYELQERSYRIHKHWHKKSDLYRKAGYIFILYILILQYIILQYIIFSHFYLYIMRKLILHVPLSIIALQYIL